MAYLLAIVALKSLVVDTWAAKKVAFGMVAYFDSGLDRIVNSFVGFTLVVVSMGSEEAYCSCSLDSCLEVRLH